MIDIFNDFPYMVLDWQDIFGIICGTLSDLSKISIIFWSDPAS